MKELKEIAEEARQRWSEEDEPFIDCVESACLQAIKAFCEREPSNEAIYAGMDAYQEFGTVMTRYRNVYRSMMQAALREMEK